MQQDRANNAKQQALLEQKIEILTLERDDFAQKEAK